MDINWQKNTTLFLIGQAVTLFGSMIVQYAILWHITLETQSGAMMTVFTLAGFLPMFFISPFGGVWADRFNRKYLINIADGVIALTSLVVALLLLGGFDRQIGLLLVCAVIRSLGQGVQMPAVGAFIPQIVPQEHLTQINGIQASIQSFVALATPVISGALMSLASLEILFFIDVVTAVIGISILFFLVKIPVTENNEAPGAKLQKPEYFYDLKAGMRYIKKHGYLLRLMALSAAFMFFASPAALLTPLQTVRNFGNDVWRLTAIEIAFSVGMMLGGLLIGLWGGFKNRIFTMALACVLLGFLTVGLGAVPIFWVYIGIMALTGLSLPLYNTPVMVLLQTAVDPAFMGRVFSIFMMLTSVTMPIGMLVFGPLADRISINLLLIVTGVVMSLLSIPFVASKTLREAGQSSIE
jgi:DHA3 family macrolide efflux protein-like MFS transporter